MEDWLNDTSVDGFLGNLREPEKFIETNAKWNATRTGSASKPAETTMVEDAVGLLNYFEYVTSYKGASESTGYLNNGLQWWTLTPYSGVDLRYVANNGNVSELDPFYVSGVRPSINLKSDVKIVDGSGTIDNPYRLNGDNDSNLSGTLLSSRYSGEYIKFGNDENNLYRIVSHENGIGTKIVSTEPLKSSEKFIESAFGGNYVYFSSANTIGEFLNEDYLTNYVNSKYGEMIEDSTTWYLGTVEDGTSYKLAKYKDDEMSGYATSTTNAKVGLLRYGELMAGQFDRSDNNTVYWTLTPESTSNVRYVYSDGDANSSSPSATYGVRPSLNLKSNVVIIEGDGTKNNPFTIELSS